MNQTRVCDLALRFSKFSSFLRDIESFSFLIYIKFIFLFCNLKSQTPTPGLHPRRLRFSLLPPRGPLKEPPSCQPRPAVSSYLSTRMPTPTFH